MRLPIHQQKNEPAEYFRMAKPNIQLPDFMSRCIDGADHPLNIEYDDYAMVKIGKAELDVNYTNKMYDNDNTLSQEEEELIQLFKERPEMQWAIHNSFDGIYIKKYKDLVNLRTIFQFGVYMKKSQKTFWLLKYSDVIYGQP